MSNSNSGPNGPANLGVCMVGVIIALVLFAACPPLFLIVCAGIGLLGGLRFVSKF